MFAKVLIVVAALCGAVLANKLTNAPLTTQYSFDTDSLVPPVTNDASLIQSYVPSVDSISTIQPLQQSYQQVQSYQPLAQSYQAYQYQPAVQAYQTYQYQPQSYQRYQYQPTARSYQTYNLPSTQSYQTYQYQPAVQSYKTYQSYQPYQGLNYASQSSKVQYQSQGFNPLKNNDAYYYIPLDNAKVYYVNKYPQNQLYQNQKVNTYPTYASQYASGYSGSYNTQNLGGLTSLSSNSYVY